MANKRLYEIARDHKLSSDALMALVNRLGFDVRSHMSVATDEILEAIEGEFSKQREALKAEIAVREKKTRERKARARQVEDEARERAAEAQRIADNARKEEEERKAKEAAAAAEVARAEAAAKAARQAVLTPPPPPPPPQHPAAPSIVSRPPQAPPPPPQARPSPTRITGRPGGATIIAPPARPAGPVVTGRPASPAAASGPPSGGDSQHKRRRRTTKKKRQRVDQQEVAASFRKTIAQLGTRAKPRRRRRRDDPEGGPFEEPTKSIEVNEFMSVSELAQKMGVTPTEVVAKCMELGMLATMNQRLDTDTIETVALEFDYNVTFVSEIGADEIPEEEDAEGDLVHRAPVVTVMGHVDHGKTSLLEHIRESNIIAGESGGITQHIGAYRVKTARGMITFLDTPGHAAFTAMRARGAQLTDIVVLVVAADDAVMPQTIEAISHAQAASVPIVVAINKMDKPGADADNVRNQLSHHGLIPEEWGGKTIMVPVSAKTGDGVDRLLEMILLQAEVLELKANPGKHARGVIVEAKLDKGRGSVTTVLVQNGTLRTGDFFVTGPHSGRIRSMVDDHGKIVKEVGPGIAVQVTGSNGVPQAGDSFVVCEDEHVARNVSQMRERVKREQTFHRLQKTTLSNVYERIKEGEVRDLRLIIKGDVDGSVEVLADTLTKIKSEEVQVNIIHRGVGAINESDILLAAASEAVVVGFHVRPDSRARELAVREGVDIRLYSIIYEVESDIRAALEGMLAPEKVEEQTGVAVVKNTFKISRLGTVAGCEVTEGNIHPRDQVRIVRDGVTIYTGLVQTVRRFTDDVKEVSAGLECGIKIENFNDLKVGDSLELFRVVEHERKLV
ncbi:MAG: translation initiation factor IF-2 [candidate division Zixibacteria bacterium]|nr:translation initiation factor IF-2 [candidate division Zixibacteria bacterium]